MSDVLVELFLEVVDDPLKNLPQVGHLETTTTKTLRSRIVNAGCMQKVILISVMDDQK